MSRPPSQQGNVGYKGTSGTVSGSKFPGGKADADAAASRALMKDHQCSLTKEFNNVKGSGNAGGTTTKS